jgi:hypothetical protein
MAGRLKFDLSRLSWKDSKALSVQQMKLARAQDERDVAGVEAGFNGLETFLAKVVVDVPRDWLVADAPEVIDWSDPASFDWLRGGRMKDLMKAVADAQSPGEASGN